MDTIEKKQSPLQWPPFPGQLGLKITQTVDKKAWQQWQEMQIKIINENRLDLSKAEDRQTLLQHLRQFLHVDAPKTDSSST